MAAFAPVLGQSLRSRPPRNPNSQTNDSPRQLEFSKAMEDFKNMFPEMDDEVIEAVLRANNGLVDATIDQLLSMGAGEENTNTNTVGFPHLPSYTDAGPREPPPAYSPREEEPNLSESGGIGRPLPARPYSAWNPPLLGNLPDDFLRLDRTPRPTTDTHLPFNSPISADRQSDREREQFLEDEKLAKFLQNEEFVREMTHNTDFMMSLERDKQRSMAINSNNVNETPSYSFASSSSSEPESASIQASSGHPDVSNVGAVGGSSPVSQQQDDVVLREKLKHMGKSTRKKLDRMARIFHRKKTSQRANLIVGGAASTANLLEDYEEDEDDDLLDVMASGRLEIMNEGESEDNGDKDAQTKESTQRVGQPRVKAYDPVEFYAEDNEFEYKTEK